MFGSPFIRAIEIWSPGDNGSELLLEQGYYEALEGFEMKNRGMTISQRQNLPLQTWSEGRPLILEIMSCSNSPQVGSVSESGLNCAVSIPVLNTSGAGKVVVFYCGSSAGYIGAIELWNKLPDDNQIGLSEGYFSNAGMFEFASRHIKFMKGFGLPGIVWSTGMPFIMNDLGRNKRFVRSRNAQKAGISRAVGIPCLRDSENTWVLTFLSSPDTPVASRFEYWIPDGNMQFLSLGSGICETAGDLAAGYDNAAIPVGQGSLGTALGLGLPVLNTDLSAEPGMIAASATKAGLKMILAMPIISYSSIRAVAAWYL